ncbi:hypothetical protein, partial [Bacteroides uniformis]|uniref:hypothetical protein n=1 Tax=Bacteroides uniformis TaxID=820 RepID=UPI001AA1A3D2
FDTFVPSKSPKTGPWHHPHHLRGGGTLDQGLNINTSLITIQLVVEPHSHGLKGNYLGKIFPFNLDYEWI